MRKDFVRTKVILLIIILVLSSFGLFVTGSNIFVDRDLQRELPQDLDSSKKAWEPPAYKTTSRATAPEPGSKIQNDGDQDGYFLGKIDPATFRNAHSTLDNYLDYTDLANANAKDKPAFPGSVDIEFDLTVESRWVRDDNGTNGDEMLYDLRVWNDYTDVQKRNEQTWEWSDIGTPFGEVGGESNIHDTFADNWINNNLTINGMPADSYNPYFEHSNARWEVSDNNTVGDDDTNVGKVAVVNTAEVFNNSVTNQYIDVHGDANLNDTNDPNAVPPEYRDLVAIHSGPKVFEGFTLDVKTDAKPGVYRFKTYVSYKYQTWAPLPSDNYEAGIPAGKLHTTNGFGDFEPYFWIPWNNSKGAGGSIGNVTQYNSITPPKYIGFKKVSDYFDQNGDPRYDTDDIDGYNSWEAIPDMSTNVDAFNRYDIDRAVTAPDYKGYLDWDGDDIDNSATNRDIWNQDHPSGAGFGVGQFDTKFNAHHHLDVGDDITTTYPVGLPKPDHDYSFLNGGNDDGNGTWQFPGLAWKSTDSGVAPVGANNKGRAYSGFEGDVVWATATESYWVQVTVFSGSDSQFEELDNEERGLKATPSAASDSYVTDGDKFEEFGVTISNGEYIHYATTYDFKYKDIIATLVIKPEDQKWFTIHGGAVARVKELEDKTVDLKFRISSDPQTPPGFYYFTLNWEYTKVYFVEKGTNDPRNDVTVRSVETTLVEFFVEFSPDLAVKDAKLGAQPGMRALDPKLVIDTGTNKTLINFTIENTGNVELIGDAQYLENANYYDGKLGDLGMYIAGIELLGSPYYEEDEINNPNLYLDIEPIIIPAIAVGESMYVDVPVKVGHNWDNLPGIYRVHLNFRGFYFDPGNFTPASQFVYTEIRWEPNAAAKDKSFVYRDLSGDGVIGVGDANDETDGIYADIEIVNFDPNTRELGINSFKIDGVTAGTITQGTTSVELEIQFINNANFDMMNVEVMLGIGGNYFSVFSHYDIDTQGKTEDTLVARKPMLAPGETFNATFTINGIDRLTPTGWHHLPINYLYDFYELPGFMSSYGIVWMDDGNRFRGYIDEDTDGVKDVGDNNELMAAYNYDGGYLPILVVEDNLLDVIAVQNIAQGQQLDLGAQIRNYNLRIDLTSREYVAYTQIVAYLETTALTENGEFIQVLENPILLDNTAIKGVFNNPASDGLAAQGGQNSLIFNVNLVDPIKSDTSSKLIRGGLYTFNLTIIATNDDTNERNQYTIPVNIRVMPVDPILMISNLEILDPVTGGEGIIKPGREFDLRITLENRGDDVAREIYVTLSNDWYEDDPFFLIDAFVTSISAVEQQDYLQDCTDCYTESAVFKRVPNATTLADLSVDHTVDIVDSERVLMSPAAQVSRLYIEEIEPGTTDIVTFRMRADTHMQKGKAYEEVVLLEFRDSYGSRYDWTAGPRYSEDMAYAITLTTKENDDWSPESVKDIEDKYKQDIENYQYGLAGVIILLIIFVILLLYIWTRRRKEEEGEPEREYVPPPAEEEAEEEGEEEEAEEEGEEEEEAEEEGEEEEEEEEDDWGAPEEEEKVEEEEEDWGAPEEEEEPAEEEWTTPTTEEEEEEEWSLDKE